MDPVLDVNPPAGSPPAAQVPAGAPAGGTPQGGQPQGQQAAPAGQPAAPQGQEPQGAQGGTPTLMGQPPPPEIKVELPQGVEVAPELMTAVKESFQKGGAEGAQALVNAYLEYQKQAAQQAEQEAEKAHEARKAGWVEQVRKDAELGGQNFDTNMNHVRRALGKYGSAELTKFLETTGLGSHPELFRFVARIGKDMKEDSVAGSQSPAAAPKSEQDLLRQMYPSMFPQQ